MTAPVPDHAPVWRVDDFLAAWSQAQDEDTPSVRLSRAAHWFCQEHRIASECVELVQGLIRQAVEETR